MKILSFTQSEKLALFYFKSFVMRVAVNKHPIKWPIFIHLIIYLILAYPIFLVVIKL